MKKAFKEKRWEMEGTLTTLDNLLHMKILEPDEYVMKIINDILELDYSMQKFITFIEIPPPDVEALFKQSIENKNVKMLTRYTKLLNKATEDQIKRMIKNTTNALTGWIPIKYRKDRKFRKWLFENKRILLLENLISFMEINEIQEYFGHDIEIEESKLYHEVFQEGDILLNSKYVFCRAFVQNKTYRLVFEDNKRILCVKLSSVRKNLSKIYNIFRKKLQEGVNNEHIHAAQ